MHPAIARGTPGARFALLLAAASLVASCTVSADRASARVASSGTPPPWQGLTLPGQLLAFGGGGFFLAPRAGAGTTPLALPLPASPVEAAVSASGRANSIAILTIDRGVVLHVFDLTQGRERIVPFRVPGPPRGLAWSQDARFLAWGAGTVVGTIERASGNRTDLARGVTVDAVLAATEAGEVLYRAGDSVFLAAPQSDPRLLATGLAEATYTSPLSPDGRWLIVSRCTDLCQGANGQGPDYASVYNAFTVALKTGTVRQVTQQRPVAGLTGRGALLTWLADSPRFLWAVRGYADQPQLPDTIYRVDAVSGEAEEILRSRDLYALRASPDGRTVYMRTVCCGRLTRAAGLYAVDLVTRQATALTLPDQPGLRILGAF